MAKEYFSSELDAKARDETVLTLHLKNPQKGQAQKYAESLRKRLLRRHMRSVGHSAL